MNRGSTRNQSSNAAANVALLESLIDRVRACEQVFDLTHVARDGRGIDDIVFVDDLAESLKSNAAVNELCADSASMALAARYSAMMKAALHILLQIRQLQIGLPPERA